MNVLLILDHAPDYREEFFRELGKFVHLTVVAQPCRTAGLNPPEKREGYRYIELPSRSLFGFVWQAGLFRVIRAEQWDVLCVGINLRHVARFIPFFWGADLRGRWIWRGHVFGKMDAPIVERIRKYFLQNGAGCLAYSEPIANEIKKRYGVKAVSFNNTQVRANEFLPGIFEDHAGIRLLYVGRNQPRKKLQRLIDLADRRDDIEVRLIGPGMETLHVPNHLRMNQRVSILGRVVGSDLVPHFAWGDLVANPGHVGLLVMNSAKFGKGIVIDSKSAHAPEYYLAEEAGQPFVDFSSETEVDRFFNSVKENPAQLQRWGHALQTIAIKKYTIEYMAQVHYRMMKDIYGQN
jgi:glycosyltransferase involved in cell wall biosynthesis